MEVYNLCYQIQVRISTIADIVLIRCNPIAFVSTRISAINKYLVWPDKKDSSDEGAKIHREQEE